MTHFLTTAWHIDPIFLVGFVAVTGGYALTALRQTGDQSDLDTRRPIWFVASMALLLLAVTSPLNTLAEDYLLSAHMVQHLLLSQVVPPLLLLGLPPALVPRALKHPGVAAIERQVRWPLVAWTAGILVLWLWHVPALFDFAAANHTAGHLHHLTVLIAGLLFWWPILTPVSQSRIGAFPSVVYLVTACLASTVLGMTLTFAPETVYTAYRQPADAHGILAGLRAEGLTPRTDQQIAGLIMWMPCCLLYLAAIGGVLARWYGGAESALPSPTLRADPSPNAGRGEPDRRGATSIAKAGS